MSAWDKLLAASSLLAGTAWQLISSPKTGGGGPGSTVYVQQVDMHLDDDTVSTVISTDVISVIWQDDAITSQLTTIDFESGVTDDLIRGTV